MDEQKKSEASWEESERLGPYLLQEQVPRSAHSQGELYLATHETSGATALVLKLAAEEGAEQMKGCQVRFSTSDSPGYVAMQVEHTPWSVAPDRQSVESLVFTFEWAHAAVRRMARAVPDTREPRPRWHLGLALASAAAVCALLFARVPLAPVSPPSSGPNPVPAPVSHEVPTAAEIPEPFSSGWLADATPHEHPMLALPLPREPFKGQKRPPCTRYVQVELVGACWMPHELKAPCPNELYEYQGKCYAPIFAAKPPPQSLGR